MGWQNQLGKVVFHTIRDVQAGEELTISYIELAQAALERQAKTEALFQFCSSCESCSLQGDAGRDSDLCRARMDVLGRHLDDLSAGTIMDPSLHSAETGSEGINA